MKTHCIHGHELTPENLYPNGSGCRTCGQIRSRARALNRPKKPKRELVKRTPKVAPAPFCVHGHALTDATIYVNPRGYVVCKVCKVNNDVLTRRNPCKRAYRVKKRVPKPGSGVIAPPMRIGRGYSGWGVWQ